MRSSPELQIIRTAAARAELRMRLGRAVAILPSALLGALGLAAVVLSVRKVLPERLSERGARWMLVAVGCALLGALAVAALRRLPPLAGAIALDRHHGLRGRLPNALEFAARPGVEQPALAEAAIDDACQRARALSPRRAVPIAWPRGVGLTALVALAVVALAVLEVHRVADTKAPPPVAQLEPLVLPPDDVELFKQALDELKHEEHTPEVQNAIEKFNALVEDIANRRLNRSEAFRRMEEIEHELSEGQKASALALQEALKETAAELKKSELSEPLAKTLEQNQLPEAEKQLKQLAESLRRKGKQKGNDQELERLRKALEAAAEKKKEALEAINEKRAELRQDLLKKKKAEHPDGGAPEDQEQKLLEKKERELERLDRESERREQAARALSKLDRDLAKAAEDLMRDLGQAAEDLEQAAEDINRLEQEQMSDKDKEELRQRLEELRELIRQQGQGGQKRMARMMRFGQKARGQGGKGQGQKDRDGQGQSDGDLKQDKSGGADGEEKMLVIGPGGQPIPMPGQGSQGSGSQGSEGREQGGQPGEPGGKGIGHEAGADPKGKNATDPKMSTEDVQAEGLDTKQGATNAQVILAAADRGFQGRPYKRVYREYRTVAEDQINKEDIPDGFRFYVRRYFQLIRPRE
jgi:hypothetical protein